MAKSGRKPGSVRRSAKTSPRAIGIAKKHAQALQLRMAGTSFQAIADALGYTTPQGAYEAVKAALLATVREPADELRKVDLERLEKMLFGIWRQATEGNQGAIDRALRVLERRAKLLGLDAPVKTELTGADGGPLKVEHEASEALLARLERLAGGDKPG